MCTFTLGCDPELVCRLNGRFVNAHNYFKSNSSFGLDGCESVAELRPGFSESPIDLTAKIYQIIEYGHSKQPDLEFISGHFSDQYAIGGHIHFSIQPKPEIINALDTVLYSLSNCIDDRDQRTKREKCGYGKRKSFRNQPHGFEYRTPGSWLLSPSTTLVTLTMAKLAILGATELNLDFSEIKGRQHSQTFLKNFKNNFIEIPEDCLEGLKELDLLLAKQLNWNSNILPNWGFISREAA
ncbi:MAG: hypothetical protein KF816_17235 [Melioribacteraceae bacterium]|nr:hypothetical protein [Melioribacteraceae bacterium]